MLLCKLSCPPEKDPPYFFYPYTKKKTALILPVLYCITANVPVMFYLWVVLNIQIFSKFNINNVYIFFLISSAYLSNNWLKKHHCHPLQDNAHTFFKDNSVPLIQTKKILQECKPSIISCRIPFILFLTFSPTIPQGRKFMICSHSQELLC